MIIQVETTNAKRKCFEGCSFDDKDAYKDKYLTIADVGASLMEIDTGKLFKLNTESDQKTLKWYKL